MPAYRINQTNTNYNLREQEIPHYVCPAPATMVIRRIEFKYSIGKNNDWPYFGQTDSSVPLESASLLHLTHDDGILKRQTD